jgi:hypothetical protein
MNKDQQDYPAQLIKEITLLIATRPPQYLSDEEWFEAGTKARADAVDVGRLVPIGVPQGTTQTPKL